jgi:flagellar biosynthesis/type III secretory pathway M-ring protein FliF/YscJ
LLTHSSTELLKDPATTPLGRRKQLQDAAKLSDEELKGLTPEQIRVMFQSGADLDKDGKPKQKDSSLKISISLDLDVEVHLTARIQGDITIGLL